jgi:hypothetical protein
MVRDGQTSARASTGHVAADPIAILMKLRRFIFLIVSFAHGIQVKHLPRSTMAGIRKKGISASCCG